MIIPYSESNMYEVIKWRNVGSCSDPVVHQEHDSRASSVLMTNGEPYMIHIKRNKIGFDLSGGAK